MFARLVPETKPCSLIPGVGIVSTSMSVVHEWYIMIRKPKLPEFLTVNDSIPYAAMS